MFHRRVARSIEDVEVAVDVHQSLMFGMVEHVSQQTGSRFARVAFVCELGPVPVAVYARRGRIRRWRVDLSAIFFERVRVVWFPVQLRERVFYYAAHCRSHPARWAR